MNADRPKQSGVSSSVAGKASRAVLWNLLFVPSLLALTVLSSAVVARSLSIDDYAIYGLAMATVTSLLLLSDLGITSAVARFTPEIRKMGPESTRRFLRTAAWSRIAAMGLVVLGLVAARGFAPLADALPFHGVSLALVLAVAAVQSLSRVKQYYLTGLLDRRAIGFIQFAAGIVQPALVILAVAAGYGVPGILAGMALSSLLELALLSAHAGRQAGSVTPPEARAGVPAELERDAARFAGVSFAEKLASYLNSPSFVLFLLAGLGSGSEDVAMFTIAGDFTFRIVSLLTIPFAGITLPVFSFLEADGRREDSTMALRLHIIVLVLLFIPAAGLLTALSSSVVPLLYSIRYSEAAPILTVLVPFLFLEYTVYSALLAALMTRRRYIEVLASKLPVLLGLPLIVYVIPRWGAVGAALVLGLTRLASAGILLAAGLREFRFRFPLGFTAKVLGATCCAALAAAAFPKPQTPGWGSFVTAVLLGGVVFAIVYRVSGGMEAADRERLLIAAPRAARGLRFLL
jgi:O-antigen/teichoic acid export membrane protein